MYKYNNDVKSLATSVYSITKGEEGTLWVEWKVAKVAERSVVHVVPETDFWVISSCLGVLFLGSGRGINILLGQMMSKTLLFVTWDLWMVNIFPGSLPDV